MPNDVPITQIEEDLGENFPQPTPSYEDNLIAQTQEDQVGRTQGESIQGILALGFGAATHALEVRNSLKLLRGEIDINKLVNDPRYKAQVERALRLTNRYGRIVKKGDLVDKVPKIERVIEKTNACHSRLLTEKSSMLLNDNLYLRRLQSAYNLDDKQLKALTNSAWDKVRENPSLSIKDSLRIEAENFSIRRVTKEVENEIKDKIITPEEKKAQIEKKLTEKHIDFETSLTTIDAKTGVVKSYADYENKRIDAIIKAQIEENKQVLSTKPQPLSQSPPPPPQSITQPHPTITAKSFPQIRINLPVPNVSLPVGLKQGVGKMFGGLGEGLKSVFGSNGLISKGLNSLKELGTSLGKKAIPPLLAADIINNLMGGVPSRVVSMVIMGAIIIAVSLPIIIIYLITSNPFASSTASNPTILRVSVKNDKNIGWIEFEQKFLTQEKNRNMDLSWSEFEKDYLSLQKQLLSSLDANRHDDVQK